MPLPLPRLLRTTHRLTHFCTIFILGISEKQRGVPLFKVAVTLLGGGGERERERERERQTDRQTQRQRQTETDRQTQIQRERERESPSHSIHGKSLHISHFSPVSYFPICPLTLAKDRTHSALNTEVEASNLTWCEATAAWYFFGLVSDRGRHYANKPFQGPALWMKFTSLSCSPFTRKQ